MSEKIPCCQNLSQSRKDLDKVLDFLKLINEPNRLKILCLLRKGEQCVCDIWKELGIRQNLTSHHLKAMREFGLIVSKQEGRNIIYSTNKRAVIKYALLLNNFLIDNL